MMSVLNPQFPELTLFVHLMAKGNREPASRLQSFGCRSSHQTSFRLNIQLFAYATAGYEGFVHRGVFGRNDRRRRDGESSSGAKLTRTNSTEARECVRRLYTFREKKSEILELDDDGGPSADILFI